MGLATLPNGGVLVTARDSYEISGWTSATGRLARLGTVPGIVASVDQQGEAGPARHRRVADVQPRQLVFVYYSTASDNRIAAMTSTAADPADASSARPP